MCKYLHIILRIIAIFALRIRSFVKRATVFRYSIKLPQTTISVINEGCQLTPYRGVSIGGIRQYHAGCGNPDGIELFIKSASRLFFQ